MGESHSGVPRMLRSTSGVRGLPYWTKRSGWVELGHFVHWTCVALDNNYGRLRGKTHIHGHVMFPKILYKTQKDLMRQWLGSHETEVLSNEDCACSGHGSDDESAAPGTKVVKAEACQSPGRGFDVESPKADTGIGASAKGAALEKQNSEHAESSDVHSSRADREKKKKKRKKNKKQRQGKRLAKMAENVAAIITAELSAKVAVEVTKASAQRSAMPITDEDVIGVGYRAGTISAAEDRVSRRAVVDTEHQGQLLEKRDSWETGVRDEYDMFRLFHSPKKRALSVAR